MVILLKARKLALEDLEHLSYDDYEVAERAIDIFMDKVEAIYAQKKSSLKISENTSS